MTAQTNDKRLAKARGVVLAVLLAVCSGVVWADHEDGQASSFLFLQPGFTQDLFGVAPDVIFDEANGFEILGDVAFRPSDQDPWVTECLDIGSPLHRFDRQGVVTPDPHDSELHPRILTPTGGTGAGCGIVNHPNGSLYSNTSQGVVRFNAETGAFVAALSTPPGNALGIAVDPLTNNIFYLGAGCDPDNPGPCPIHEITPAGVLVQTILLPGIDASWVDGLYFDPTGNYIFLANRQNDLNVVQFRLTILERTVQPGADAWTIINHVPMACEPDGVAFHVGLPPFVVTNNTNQCILDDPTLPLFGDPELEEGPTGTMFRFDFPLDPLTGQPDYSLQPVQTVFAAGGFRGDLMKVAADGCIYLTQAGTRYDDLTTTPENSLVKICALVGPGFAPAPGVQPPPPPPQDPIVTFLQTAPATARVGSTIQYQLQYYNAGPFPSSNARVVNVLPPEVAFVSASSGAIRDTRTGTVRWNLGTVPVGQGGTLTITVRVRTGTPVGTAIRNYAEYMADLTLAPPAAAVTLVVP